MDVLFVILWELPGVGMCGRSFFPNADPLHVETSALIIGAEHSSRDVKIVEVTGGTIEQMTRAMMEVMPIGGDGASLCEGRS